MKRTIFITGRYLPKPEATGLCIHKIAKEIADGGATVEAFCMGDSDNELCIDGVVVHQIKAPIFMRENEMSKTSVFVSRIHKLLHFSDYPLRSKRLRNRYIRAVLNTIREEDEIRIVASFSPFEAVSSMVYIKKRAKCKTLDIFYYSADTLSNEQGNSALLSASFREKKGFKQEIKIFKQCKNIFIMECHKQHYLDKKYDCVRDKIIYVDFPLIDPSLYSSANRNHNSTIQILFAGTLYRILRNPSFACDTFLKIHNIDYKLVFVGGGDCSDILKQKQIVSSGKIEYLGKKPYETVKELLSESDVLLSIGNSESPMMPSKIYEYISTGKPIIHFSTWEKDPCIPVLEKYENALIINGDADIKIICSFISCSHQVSWEAINRLFYKSAPSFTAKFLRW